MFLTNNSMPTSEDLCLRLKRLGIDNITPRHFYTSAHNTADFLVEADPLCSAYVIGEGGILTALNENKIANDSIAPNYVIIGEGSPTIEKLNRAHEFLEKGAKLLVTNPDNWCPVAESKTRPGAGAIAAFLEASSGKRAYFLGKPNPFMFYKACKKLYELSMNHIEQVIMIGDTLETDIRGAVESGIGSYLVLSGSTRLEDLADSVYQPTRVIHSVQDLVQEIITGIPDSQMLTPIKQHLSGKMDGKKKHYNDTKFIKPRPAMTR
jgi:NagD protein